MEHVNVMLNDTVDYKIVFIPQLYLSKVRPRLKMKLNKKLKITCVKITTFWVKTFFSLKCILILSSYKKMLLCKFCGIFEPTL